MFSRRTFIQHKMKSVANQQGFAVLTSAVLLSMAGIAFTANMASSQLVDNQIIGNYYRNNEAFANAESGMNFVLSQLDDSTIAKQMLANLPYEYENSSNHFTIKVTQVNQSKILITSDATSMDGSAKRQINLEVDFFVSFPIPAAAVSSNGKLNLDDSALVNDGCEGLAASDCLGGGNIAEHMLVSNPAIEEDADDLCSGGQLGENVIADNVLKGEGDEKIIQPNEDGTGYDWGELSIPEGSEIGGLTPDSDLDPNSLFEATFGMEMSQDNLDDLWDNAAKIDMRYGGDCSDMLQDVSDQDEIVYIKGDCNISQFYAEQSKTSENKVFSIGSTEYPKLVFIEGGTFITAPNTGTSVVGMLYFLPAIRELVDDDGNYIDEDGNLLAEDEEPIKVTDASVDMGGIDVNGALLSEYKCSHDGYDKTDNKGTKQHFSARFDKLVLEALYSDLGMGVSGTGYRLAAGTWRDF
ncbi:hypothetical protein CW745_10745 [Psychromonas sp. psych-6C06]|uniref:hypothetical protein n=1 Tax=Psychromonas sp. psych-6C06 TaxID=2058089 RepID=UPI000C33711B|nr:hypothetical protein [Psychromonas sp. psych-6C06]PKF61784.1 hypothetical protein CW745_10745 [Psychromonas sp. psych-6C06]